MGWRIGLLAGVAGLAVACGTTAEDERFDLLARDHEFSIAVRDIDKALAFYTPDASLCLPGMPMATGAANIRSAAMKFGASVSIEWEPTEVGLSASADLGFIQGTYRVTPTGGPDETPSGTGHFLEVWKKTRGDWKVAEHFFHPDPQ
jgi:ketosteroid isomerase-like protein